MEILDILQRVPLRISSKFRTYLEVLLTTRLDTLGGGQGKLPHFWAEVRGGAHLWREVAPLLSLP